MFQRLFALWMDQTSFCFHMPSTRKRGKELENAILEAAFEIFQTSGYPEMTFQNIAKKAKTSRTVLYRQ
ncbi:TetR/AcrR family transcriptional regulator [Paenibacillus sacheonensis]|uniref:TetR/AcrR family transcriptional regulator n=1 Tax=Paenibacillus sacheonensis TaxID=742054 RepID=UPI003B82D8D5